MATYSVPGAAVEGMVAVGFITRVEYKKNAVQSTSMRVNIWQNNSFF